MVHFPSLSRNFTPSQLGRLVIVGLFLLSSVGFSLNFSNAKASSLAPVFEAGSTGVPVQNSGPTYNSAYRSNPTLAATTISLTSSSAPSAQGQNVTFTATVIPASATGTVNFTEGAATLGTGTLSNGVASFTTNSLTVGRHTIIATYAGNGSYSGSSSAPLDQVVVILTTFTSSGVISVPDIGPATVYPSTVTASGVRGNLISATVQLTGLSYTSIHDLDMLLVGPTGQKTLFMSNAYYEYYPFFFTVDLLFDDNASNFIDQIGTFHYSTPLPSGTYKPSVYLYEHCNNFVFEPPAPDGPYPTTLSTFRGTIPNGSWKLFIRDSCVDGYGGHLNNWSINLYTYPKPMAFPVSGSGQTAPVATTFATPFQVLVRDANANLLPGAVVTFTAPSSGASGTFVGGGSTYTATSDSNGLVTAPAFTANTTSGSYTVTATISDTTFPVVFTMTNIPGPPAKISATGGSSQHTNVTDYFNQPLVATAYDRFNNPVSSNQPITFTAPNSGPAGVFDNNSNVYVGTTDASGRVTATVFTANNQVGSYTVAATVSGAASPAAYSLVNDPLSPVQFQNNQYAVSEGAGTAVITLTRPLYTSGAITANVGVKDLTTSSLDYILPNLSGGLDTSFNPGSGANSDVNDILVQPDGKILVGGSFTSYNGITVTRIVRLNPDGSLDNSFNPGSGPGQGGKIDRIALQPDGKIIVVGDFTNFNRIASGRIARLNSDGSLDSSFDSSEGANAEVTSLALQADGKIVIVGSFTTYNTTARHYVARLNPNGSLDTGFNSSVGADNSVWDVAVQPADGKIIIAGNFANYNNTNSNHLARLNPDGSLDNSFIVNSPVFNAQIWRVVLQSDGKVLIINDYLAIRILSDGSIDTSFDTGRGANGSIRAITVQPDGKILVAGDFTTFGGTEYGGAVRNHLARLNPDGSLDRSFEIGTGANDFVGAIALQREGRILIGGRFTNYNGTAINRIARVGTIPISWNAGDSSPKTFGLSIVDDTLFEANEQLVLTVNSVSNGGSLGTPVSTTLTILDNDRQITATLGSGQSAPIGTVFSQPLVAQTLLPNTVVTFTAPTSGASGTFAGSNSTFTGTSDANGLITTTNFTANLIAGSYVVSAAVANGVNPALFSLTNLAGAPASITAVSGSGQTIPTSNIALQPFVAKVVDSGNNPLGGVVVTFTAPIGGATGTFAGGQAVYPGTTTASGFVTATLFTANSTPGSYTVTATVAGVANSATFQLTNGAACDYLLVTSNQDDGSCGTLRQAVAAAPLLNSNGGVVTINLSAGSVISLSSGLTLTNGVSITTTAVCGVGANNSMVPPITLQGVGAGSGSGLTLAGHNSLYGLWVRGFSGVQIKAPAGSSTKMQCVRASTL